MQFKATKKQVQQIAVNAIEASQPMGLGHLHFKDKEDFKPDMVPVNEEGLTLDYVGGRMVKLWFKREGNVWETTGVARSDYQSWVSKYPTYRDLVLSVPGVEVIGE